jgi:hypothetical protein
VKLFNVRKRSECYYPIQPAEREAFYAMSLHDRREALSYRRHRISSTWTNGVGESALVAPPTMFQRALLRACPWLPRNFTPPAWMRGRGVQGWVEALDSIVADGTQISNSTAEAIICPDFNIPAFYFAPGRTLRYWAFGVMSNVVTTPGTFIYRIRWGGVAGVVLVQSGAQGLDTTAHTNALWAAWTYIVCRTAGATGTFMSGGQWANFNLLASTAANLLPAMLGSAGAPGASGNVAVTVDTTAAKLLSGTGTFSVATSPTNLTCQQRVIEALN